LQAALLLVASSAVACGDDATTPASPDAGVAPAIDAAATVGFGSISGACGVLDDELVSATPGFFRLAIDFERAYTDADEGLLSPGAREILAEGNAGGSSVLSEVFAYEVLQRCEDALLLKTETKIEYDTAGKLTDFLAEMDAEKIGVSVTRALSFPFDSAYAPMAASDLLDKKLGDILVSSANVAEVDRWKKQVLAILAYGPAHAETLEQAYAALDGSLKADTLVYVIVTDGADDFIYCDGVCE
jgi:hypothetical protein